MSPLARLACGWITLFVVGTDLFIISPLLPRIAAEFGGSAASSGLTVTVFAAAYLLSAPLFGLLADQAGRRRVLIACLTAFATANLLTATASSFIWLLLARAAAGAAASGVSPLIYAGVNEAAPPARRATWMAIAVSGLLLALSVGAPSGTIIASYLGWRAPFLILALISLALTATNRMIWPADPSPGRRAPPAVPRGGQATIARRLTPTVLWATALYEVYTYIGVWLTGAGLSPSNVARAIGCYGIGALAGTLLGGRSADRFGTRITLVASLTGLVACLCALAADIGTGYTAEATLLLTSAFAQLFFPAQQAALARDFPQRRAFMLALNNSALFLGISIGSLIGGEAMARLGFSANAAVGAAIAGVALVLVSTNDRVNARDSARTIALSGKPAEQSIR